MQINQTPNPDKIFTVDNIDFLLQISIENDNIVLISKPVDPEIPFYYKYQSNLEDFYKNNIIFSVFDSSEERKEFLIGLTSKRENISLKKQSNTNADENEGIMVELKYIIDHRFNKTIKFTLYEIIPDEKKMIKYLKKLLNKSELKNSIALSDDSKLLSNISQIDLIKTGIKNYDNSKKMKLTLLFRASRDGDTTNAFHSKVDGISPTISLIQTKNNYIFGGFTELAWDSYSKCKKTNNTFMFSFNKNKIYIGKNGGFIHCTKDHGPWFCNGAGIYLNNYFKSDKNCFQWELSQNQKYYEGFTEDFEFVGGRKFFTVNEVEVFKVEYI